MAEAKPHFKASVLVLNPSFTLEAIDSEVVSPLSVLEAAGAEE